jgi:hypothetical protein
VLAHGGVPDRRPAAACGASAHVICVIGAICGPEVTPHDHAATGR